MKFSFKEIVKYLFDWKEDVQDRLLVLLTMIALSGMILAFIGGLIVGESFLSMLTIVIAFFVFCPLVYIGYKLRKIRMMANILAFLLVYVFFPLVFFTSGGIRGGSPIWFVFEVLVIGMILRGKSRIFFFISEMISVIFCYYVQYAYPQAIIPHDEYEFFADSLGSLIIVSIILTMLMGFQTYVYLKENDIANAQRDEIDKLNKAQNSFFSSMSHEIRTPINTIIGLNEMILRENESEEIAEDAMNIQAASNMLLHLVNDILDMSKLQSGQMQLSESSYNPRDLILDVVSMLQIQAQEKKLAFNVSVAPDIPSELKGDDVRIKQILVNVLNNAIKYTEEGFVMLSVQCGYKHDGKITIIYSVSDSGIGIKKENIDGLFTAFKRMDEDKNRYIEGTGLGLSIVKQFVDLMGGKITVNSVYTKGSTFIIEIPQKVVNDEPIGRIDTSERRSELTIGVYHQSFEAPEARVLVVDDTRTNLLVVSKLLRGTRVNIDTAGSGEQALEMTLQNSYHVIFMDHLMPEMDGIECMHRIRKQTGGLSREAAFIALTANAGSENRTFYENEGFDSYLVKPVTGAAIEDELHRFLPRDLITAETTSDGSSEDSTLWISSQKKKTPVVITTSSVADIPDEFIKEYNIDVLPITIETEEGCFRDSVDIDSDGLLSYMVEEGKDIRMKELEVSEYESFFADRLQYANNIIHISVSSRIQADSCKAAVEASRSFDNVRIFDTGQISTGQGLFALAAGRMASEGKSPEEIIDSLEQMKKEIVTSFVVDNMDLLARTKKISPVVARFTKAFMIRSILTFRNGRISLSGFYFGSRDHAWKRYIKYALKDTGSIDQSRLFITHVGLSRKELNRIKEEVERRVVFDEVYFQKASPAIATTTGLGTFGLIFKREHDYSNI